MKDVPGYDDKGDDNSNGILLDFVRQMNKKPIEIVEEFLTNQKLLATEKLCSNGTTSAQVINKSLAHVLQFGLK